MKILKPSWIHHDGHPIFSIDINPDDTRFATGGQGDDNTGRVVIWNLKPVFKDDDSTPKLLCQLDHHSACVNCVRWSNNGLYLASGGDDKVVMIWKLVSKRTSSYPLMGSSVFEKNNLEVWKTHAILRGHDGDVLDLAWSKGDVYLASCSIDNTIKIWDAHLFPTLLSTLEGHTSMVKGVTWDPVGKYLASQSVDKTLRIWRTSDWTIEHVVKEPFVDCGGTTHVLRLDWSPDGLYLLSAHAMNTGFPTAQIIERDGWKVDKDFVGHRKAVVCTRFSKTIQENNRVKQCVVAIGSRDRSISVWSTALKRPVVVLKDVFSHSVLDITWSHCSTIMMACSWDGSVLAAQFTHNEIGRSLSQEETDALYQKFYGNISTTSHNVIPNMEVFLARNSIMTKENSALNSSNDMEISPEKAVINNNIIPPLNKPTNPTTPTKSESTNDTTMITTANTSPINKGPTKQIETRTADGKRRITPKFLPIPNEDNLQLEPSSSREGPSAVFNIVTSVSSPAAKTEGNLRDSMVSSIEDVSFGENKRKLTQNDANNEIKKKDHNSPPSSARGSPKPMEVDEPTTPTPILTNGIGNSSEKEKQLNGGVNGSQTNSDSGHSGEIKTPVVIVNGTSTGSVIKETVVTPSNDTAAIKPSTAAINALAAQNTTVTDVKKTDTITLKHAPTPVNIIQVKRKRPGEEMKPPPNTIKKKFTPQSLRTFPAKKSDESPIQSEANTPTNITQSRSPVKSSTSSKSPRLPALKIEKTFALQVNIKPEVSYCIEISNKYQRSDGFCHQIKCSHSPTSLQGLEWIVCTDAPICAISGDIHRIVALCEDATAHVLDLKGRYAMSPFVLSSYPSKLLHCGPHLVVITVKAVLHMWNIHTKSVVMKAESLLPILNQPGEKELEKAVDIQNVYTGIGGLPVIFLSNGKSFMFNKEMSTWTLFSDNIGPVSSPLMLDAGLPSSVLPKVSGRWKKPQPVIISHIKLQFIRATELKKAQSIQQWLVVLGKSLATHGLEKELHILCEDLLGPTHSSAKPGVTWMPTIAECVDKRKMLREILNGLLDDLRWQDLFCEFDELLKDVEKPNS